MNNIFEMILEEVLEEKIIKVKHMKAKAKAKARMFRIKNKAKLKKNQKKLKLKIKNRPKKKGYSWGADGKLHKVVKRKGVRR